MVMSLDSNLDFLKPTNPNFLEPKSEWAEWLVSPKMEDTSREKDERRQYLWLVRTVVQMVLSGNRPVIFIDGENMSGKSSMSLSLVDDIYALLRTHGYDLYFDPDEVFIFSALEYIQQMSKKIEEGTQENLQAGSFLVVEEGEAALANKSTAAVQEFVSNIQVGRQWQVGVIVNLPDVADVEDLLFKVGHFRIWMRGSSDVHKAVKGKLLVKYSYENDKSFVNPKGVYYDSDWRYFGVKKGVNLNFLKDKGAWLRAPYVSQDLYNRYFFLKNGWFPDLMKTQMERIARNAEVRGHSANVTRFKHGLDSYRKRFEKDKKEEYEVRL